MWYKAGVHSFQKPLEKFASGGFRDAYRAQLCDNSSHLPKEWMLKQYHSATTKELNDTLQLPEKEHTKKQVQMHSVAAHIAEQLSLKAIT